MNITDPVALGTSPVFYDFDAFEEVRVVTGAQPVDVLTGGVNLNLVNRRGGNRFAGITRIYYTGGEEDPLDLQGDNTAGDDWDQSGATPLFKLQDEFMVSDRLFLSLKTGGFLSGYRLEPKGGREVPVTFDYETTRPQVQVSTSAVYDRDDVLGSDHEIRIGLEFRNATVTSQSNFGNGMVIASYPKTWMLGAGEIWLVRQNYNNNWIWRLTGYIQDMYSMGRVTLLLALCFDRQWNGFQSASVAGNDLFGDLNLSWLPAGTSTAGDSGFAWNTFSPRLGVTLDLTGDARTLVKANFALYPAPLGFDPAWRLQVTSWREVDF